MLKVTLAELRNFSLLWMIDLTWPLHTSAAGEMGKLSVVGRLLPIYFEKFLWKERNSCLIQRFPESCLEFFVPQLQSIQNYSCKLLGTSRSYNLGTTQGKKWCREDHSRPPWGLLLSEQLAGRTVIFLSATLLIWNIFTGTWREFVTDAEVLMR